MDLMGPLPETTRGNKHVLMVADLFTKWVEAFPVQNMEAETVARVVMQEKSAGLALPGFCTQIKAAPLKAGC